MRCSIPTMTNKLSCAWAPCAWPRCPPRPQLARQSRKRRRRVPESRRHFSRRVDKALDDPNLQRALTSGLTGIRGRRDLAFESFDFAKGRAELKKRRGANLDHLPELVEQFKARLEAAGGVVHFANDAAEARDIIGQICRKAGSASHLGGDLSSNPQRMV